MLFEEPGSDNCGTLEGPDQSQEWSVSNPEEIVTEPAGWVVVCKRGRRKTPDEIPEWCYQRTLLIVGMNSYYLESHIILYLFIFIHPLHTQHIYPHV